MRHPKICPEMSEFQRACVGCCPSGKPAWVRSKTHSLELELVRCPPRSKPLSVLTQGFFFVWDNACALLRRIVLDLQRPGVTQDIVWAVSGARRCSRALFVVNASASIAVHLRVIPMFSVDLRHSGQSFKLAFEQSYCQCGDNLGLKWACVLKWPKLPTSCKLLG